MDEADEKRTAANRRASRWLFVLAVVAFVAFTVVGLIGDRTLGEAARAALTPFAIILTVAVLTRLAR